MIRVTLPTHLRTLAHITGVVEVEVDAPVTQCRIVDAIEAKYPMLRGTIRDSATQERRAFVRFFALDEDLSHESPDAEVPAEVANGSQVFRIIGAMAGG